MAPPKSDAAREGGSYAGQLLLAMPDMPDPNFHHSVIALCVHDEQGAMGIDIGTVIDGLGLRALVESFDIDPGDMADVPVLRGGPVEPRRGFILHSLDWEGENGLVLEEKGWGLSGSLDILKAIASGEGPQSFIVALGYAGWGAGQLDKELARPGWFVGELDRDLLFHTPAHKRWGSGFARNGVDPALLTVQSGHA